MTSFEQSARDHAASRGSPATREAYLRDLEKWLAHCAAASADPSRPKLADATAFRDALRARSAPLTVRRVLSSLSAAYGRALAQEVPSASWNPFHPRVLDRPPENLYAKTEAVADPVACRVLAAADADDSPIGRRDAAVLHLLRGTGLRRMSVARLPRDGVLEVPGGGMVLRTISKGGKETRKPLAAEDAKALRRHLAAASNSAWVFPSKRNPGLPIDETTVNRIVRVRAVLADCPHVHPHQFRSAFATDALDVLPLNDVQAFLDHKDPRTTQRYDRGRRGEGVVEAVAAARRKGKGKRKGGAR